jgi:hypothetical protein
MANFPGSNNALPGVYTLIETLSTGLSIPSGIRLAAIMGEGARQETIVALANGRGFDGLNPNYTGPNGSDGRHFLLNNAPVVSNRTTLFKNGIPLNGTEGVIGTPFSSNYDYRINISNGQIELQPAVLVDQGGSFYRAGANNVGNGSISALTLLDPNAPTETWTIRVSSVVRDGYGVPIPGFAKFIATGSVSGTLLDGYGNQIFWQSNGDVVANSILSFSISEGSTSFREGDVYLVETRGGALQVGDSLSATYIAETDINALTFYTDFDSLTQNHGTPNLSNRLSLGSQLAFANGVPGLWAIQTAPSIPRRTSFVLNDNFSGETDEEDLTFPLPLNVIPDVNTNINFFVTNPITGVETQILPNKVDFYDPSITANPDGDFINSASFTYSYTVILNDSVVKQGADGVLTATTGTEATLSSDNVAFDLSDLAATRSVQIFNATNPVNNGTFSIVSIAGGVLTIDGASFLDETNIQFRVIDTVEDSAKILFTDDIAAQMVAGSTIRATIVDQKDADFFDAGWISAYEELEKIDVDIIVPLPSQTISAIFQNGTSHVRTMSNIKNRKERVLFIGAIRGLTPGNVIGNSLAAVEDIGILEGIQGDDVSEILSGNIEDLANYGVQNSFGNTYRVVYFYPDEIVLQIGGDRVLVDGFFMAAAAAGYLSGIPNIAMPLTRKSLTGFTILNNKMYRPIVLEQMTAAGITVLQPIQGGGKVIRGQTTTISGFVEEREISIIFIRDRIAKQLRTAFEGFVGDVESPIFKAALTTRARAVLRSFEKQGLITQFKDLKVLRDDVDPTQYNIVVKVQPTYPINFIFIRVGVGVL